jgi:DNA-binding response OmpR family regulator
MAIRILLVDDNPETREAVNKSLSALGYAVTAVSAAHAMAAFAAETPEIVLTEVVMPGKCGIELIRDIKRANKDTRIIAMSAGGALDRGYLLGVAHKLGADLVLPKPFEMEQLLAGIWQVLSRPDDDDRKDPV